MINESQVAVLFFYTSCMIQNLSVLCCKNPVAQICLQAAYEPNNIWSLKDVFEANPLLFSSVQSFLHSPLQITHPTTNVFN